MRPRGHNYQDIRTARAFVKVVVTIFDVGQFLARLLHADRIVRAHLAPMSSMPITSGIGRRLPHVIGIRLEGKDKHSDGHAAQASASRVAAFRAIALAVVVDAQHRLDDPKLHS